MLRRKVAGYSQGLCFTPGTWVVQTQFEKMIEFLRWLALEGAGEGGEGGGGLIQKYVHKESYSTNNIAVYRVG
jgi:hypothetical protein